MRCLRELHALSICVFGHAGSARPKSAGTAKGGWELYFGLSGLMGQQFREMTLKKSRPCLRTARGEDALPTDG